MKTNHKYGLLSAVTALAVVALSLGALSSAQTVTPVTCTIGSGASITANQPVLVTATGGNGIYTVSGANITTTNLPGNQFAVSFAGTGVNTLTVNSGGQTGTCNATVVASTAPSNALMCSPSVQTVTLGQTASVSASGGDGNYAWSAPDLTISNPSGSGFSASYASTGVHALTVTDNGAQATCDINVLANPNGTPTPVTPVTPGLPDTGGGFDK